MCFQIFATVSDKKRTSCFDVARSVAGEDVRTQLATDRRSTHVLVGDGYVSRYICMLYSRMYLYQSIAVQCHDMFEKLNGREIGQWKGRGIRQNGPAPSHHVLAPTEIHQDSTN